MVLEKFGLQNRVAVITGGAGLLGRQHCEAVLEAGGDVLALDLKIEALNKLQEKYGRRLLALECDICQRSQLEGAKAKAEQHFGRHADILINNAAIDPKFDTPAGSKPQSRLENFPLESWDRELNVGLKASLLCVQVFVPTMVKSKKGVVLNVASDLGVIAPDQRLYKKAGLAADEQPVKPVTYSVIKHGLIGLTRYIATYWADQGIRCNAFAPGGVFNNHPEEFLSKLTSLIPLGRMAKQDEYKAAIVFLVSDASSYMNGATLNMDGGRSVW